MKMISAVKRIAAPALKEFHRDYVSRGEPVILTGIVGQWPAFPMMTPSVLKQTFGEVTVPVRETDDELNYFFGQSGKSEMKLADYIDAISGPPSSGKTRPYLGNIPFDHPLTRQYLQRLKAALPFPDCQDLQMKPSRFRSRAKCRAAGTVPVRTVRTASGRITAR